MWEIAVSVTYTFVCMHVCVCMYIYALGLHLICSKFYRLFLPTLPKNVIDYSFLFLYHYWLFLYYSHIVLFKHRRSRLRLSSECKVKFSSEYKSSLFEFIFINSNDLWGPSSSLSLVSHHSPFRLFLYHAHECLIILILCLWVS